MKNLLLSVFIILSAQSAFATIEMKSNLVEYRGESIKVFNTLIDTALTDKLEVPEYKCFNEQLKDQFGDVYTAEVCKHKDSKALTQTIINKSNPKSERISVLSYTISKTILAGMKRDPNARRSYHEVLRTERYCGGFQNTNCGVRVLEKLAGRVIRSINYPNTFCALKVTGLTIPSTENNVRKFHRCYLEKSF